MQEYTRLVSSRFWKMLEADSKYRKNWDNTEEMLKYLTDPGQDNGLAFVLARSLQRRFPEALSEVTPAEKLEGRVPDPEIPIYLRLMRHLMSEAQMEGSFRSSQFEKYLKGESQKLPRDNCFKLAFALAMDEDDTLELLKACSLPPFNFRSPEELICFFCFCSQRIADENNEKNPYGWSFAQTLCKEMADHLKDADPAEGEIMSGQSELMEDDILVLLDEPSSSEKKAAMLRDYIMSHAPILGGYSRRAYQCFDDLLDEIMDLLADRESDEIPEKTSIRLSWLAGKMYRNIWPQYGDGTTGDFVPLKKSTPSLPSKLTDDPLWRARLQKLKNREAPVTRHDLLFLYMIYWDLQDIDLTGRDAVESFILEADDLLYKAGMSGIYIPDSYDRLILLAIASGYPTAFLGDFYEAGADEGILRELIEKNRKRQGR